MLYIALHQWLSHCRKHYQPTQQTSSQAEDEWNDSNSQGGWGGLARGEGGNPSSDWGDEASTSGRTSWSDMGGDSGRRGGRGGGNEWGSSRSRGGNDWGRSEGRGGSEGMRGRRDWGSEARQRSSTGIGRDGREWAAGRGGWGRGRGRREAGFGGNSGEGEPWRRRQEDRPHSGPEGPKSAQLKDLLKGEALYGINPVLGALEAMRREVHTLFVQEGAPSGFPMPASGGKLAYCGGVVSTVTGRVSPGALPISCLCQWQKIKWRLP